jgi:hypothetical protein
MPTLRFKHKNKSYIYITNFSAKNGIFPIKMMVCNGTCLGCRIRLINPLTRHAFSWVEGCNHYFCACIGSLSLVQTHRSFPKPYPFSKTARVQLELVLTCFSRSKYFTIAATWSMKVAKKKGPTQWWGLISKRNMKTLNSVIVLDASYMVFTGIWSGECGDFFRTKLCSYVCHTCTGSTRHMQTLIHEHYNVILFFRTRPQCGSTGNIEFNNQSHTRRVPSEQW